MRTRHLTTATATALLLTLTACGIDTTTDSTNSSDGNAQLPDLAGENLKDAKASAEKAGFDNLTTEDVTGRDRGQLLASNWKVCTQNPDPAELKTSTEITLGVTRTSQRCPGDKANDDAKDSPEPKGPTEKDNSSGDKYEQTWKTPYKDTTCDQYRNDLTVKQSWVAAADLLVSARKQDGGKSLPADSEVDRFRKDIVDGCAPPAETQIITEIAAAIYLMDPTYEP